jgi:predicted dehydrogenase
MSNPHTVAIIGLGIMGRRMLGAMQRHDRFQPVALWDPSAESCAAAQAEAPDVPVMDSSNAAIAAADAVYLACPPVPRKAYALTAARAGKGLFLEKPFGIDVTAGRDLARQLDASKVPAAVNFTQAASRAVGEIVRSRDAGEMGDMAGIDIVVTYARWPRAWQADADWLRFRAEGGYTREVISHFMFLSQRLLGPLDLKWSRAAYPDDAALCETHIQARLEAADGTPVTVMGSVGGVQPDRQEVTVKGTQRSYRLSEFYQLAASDGDAFAQAQAYAEDPRQETLQRQLDDLDKCLRGQPHVLATVQEAFRVQELIEGMLDGA